MLIGSVVLAAFAAATVDYAPRRWVDFVVLPLLAAVLIWLFAFFRDPERPIPAEEHIMVSPADGLVSDIMRVEIDPHLGGPSIRVGIFLSVFNVHVNRSPCNGRVRSIIYKKGKFINALDHSRASDENESNTVVLEDAATAQPIAVVKQIVGLIARRIIFTAAEGEPVRRGQRIGMIKFGSRTELSIPERLEPQIQVKVGQVVRGGADVIARLGKPIHALAPVA
jgi:phosphatidylserine decarboxylase